MANAIRDPAPPTWVAAPPPRLSGETGAPLLRGWIHLAALVVTVPAGALLLSRAASTWAVGYVAVYVAGLLAVYAASAAYHLLPVSPATRYWLRRADHATIYVFIATCYTVWCGLVVRGTLSTVVLGLAWAGAAVGVVGKVTSFDRLRMVTGSLYIALGWLAVVTLPDALRALGWAQLGLLFAMGVTYTGGAVVLALRRPDPLPEVYGYHELWHTLVVASGACYFVVVWGLVAALHRP